MASLPVWFRFAKKAIRTPGKANAHSKKVIHDSKTVHDPESEPLTGYYDNDNDHIRTRKEAIRMSLKPLIFHLCLVSLYSSLFLYFYVFPPVNVLRMDRGIVQSPGVLAVEYESVYFNTTLCIDSPYFGPPSPESDQAWSDLLEHSHIQVSGEDLRRINKTSIPLPGKEDTYWGTLGVAHELHCLKRIRQYLYQDYYFPSLTSEQRQLNAYHTDHCMEIIRQSLICRGDVSLVTMFWEEHTPIPAANFDVPHECVNWNAIQEWASSRSIDPMKPGYLHHPTLGPAFVDGTNPGIGVSEMHTHISDEMLMHGSRCPT